jgi:Na+/melibiose symporter-like transporter
MLAVGMFVAIASGVRTGLELYFNLYFWELTQGQVSMLAAIAAAGALTGAMVVPALSARLGKRRGTIACYIASLLNGMGPIVLRLLGLMPENGDAAVFNILTVTFFLQGLLYVMTAVMMNSMLSDVVEDVAVKSGQRSEGLLFSADQFFTKAVSGVGVLASSAFLTLISFPKHAKPGDLPEEMLQRLAALYVPTLSVLVLIVVCLLMLFQIDRHRHEENLRRLAAAGT